MNGTDEMTSDNSDTISITPNTEDNKQIGSVFKKTHLLPLILRMPVKNDTIHITKTNKISPSPMTRHQQIPLDPSLQHELNLEANENEAMESEYVEQIPKKSNEMNVSFT
uniref:uncharacterized protein LOC120336623 n=1 Tax=Styela clava TaxID=7725 RepID=UPI00193ADDD8|nr:uncharacterized protein LOC120336623 [Styela clava]